MKYFIKIAWIFVSAVLVLSGCSGTSYLESDESDSAPEENKIEPAEETLFVQVAGSVVRPGVYELDAGSRVFQAIEAAGGLTEEADERGLNQASHVLDGDKIYVLSHAEAEEASEEKKEDPAVTEEKSGLVNINTAGLDELKTLSGIGDAKAMAIVSYREAQGGFKSVDELTQVDGIGDATLNKLREYITL